MPIGMRVAQQGVMNEKPLNYQGFLNSQESVSRNKNYHAFRFAADFLANGFASASCFLAEYWAAIFAAVEV